MKEQTRPRYEEIYPRIYRIILPLAGDKPGPVNAYLFTGKTSTLLDTGTLKSVHVLEHRLDQIGYSFSDISQIILTHGHIDHYGAARKIIEGSANPVTVMAHEEDKNLIEHGLEVPREQFLKYYRLMGVPLIFQLSLLLVRRIFLSMAENCRVDRFLSEGDKIAMGDYEATVIGTPGHTRGSISLYLEKEGILFPGDHILGHITPNAFVMLEADFDLPRRMSQVEFYDSLKKIEDISPRIVYPAHGDPIPDVRSTIAMFREQFNLRQSNIMSLLAGGEYTVYQIGRRLFPDISGTRLPLEVFLMVSEVYTHLQVLEKEDRVASHLKKGALYYMIKK
jgi:glyoxylase-like metal-dependent hydrolase (beta-lactamase superfamily II)